MDENIPRLRQRILTERLTLPIQKDLKVELKELKEVHGIDVNKWIRDLILANLPKVKSEIAS